MTEESVVLLESDMVDLGCSQSNRTNKTLFTCFNSFSSGQREQTRLSLLHFQTIQKIVLQMSRTKKKTQQQISARDLLGARIIKDEELVLQIHFALKGKTQRRIQTIELIHSSHENQETILNQWLHLINRVAYAEDYTQIDLNVLNPQQIQLDLPKKQKNFFIIINPVGGQGKAAAIFEKHAKPLFNCSNIECTVVHTENPGHAGRLCKELRLGQYDCIVGVGGDGILAEIVQGIMMREDWEDAIKHPIGVIPAGSGNGLSKSLSLISNEHATPIDAAFAIAKGKPIPLDISTTRSIHETFYSFLSAEWAYMANVDLESEKYRSLGGARFTVSAIANLFSSQKWHGKLSYFVENSSDGNEIPFYWDSNKSSEFKRKSPALQLLPELDDEIPSHWKSIEGQFSLFWAASATHMASDALIAPDAKINDGLMHLIVVHGPISRFQMTNILLGFETGKHIDHDRVQVIKTRAYILRPYTEGDLLAIDGEVFQPATFQVEVHRGMGRIMCL